MRTTELAERLGVTPASVRYHFLRWCQKNGKNPDDFKKTEEYRHGGRTMRIDVYDIPEEAVNYIEARIKELKEKHKEAKREYMHLMSRSSRESEQRENYHDLQFYRAKVGIKYGANSLLIDYLSHEELKELLKIAEENGYRISIGSDEPLVIHVEEASLSRQHSKSSPGR